MPADTIERCHHVPVIASAEVASERGPWASEVVDVVRALSGGLLFGIPLLYTMEAWWTGRHTEPERALLLLAAAVVPVLLLNHSAGFRADPDIRLRDGIVDTIETLGLGLILSATVLVLLRELETETPLDRAVGEIVYEAIPFCVGMGVARRFLHGDRNSGGDEDAGDDGGGGERAASDAPRTATRAALADVGATALGAVFIGLSIAPTDEVPMLASAMSPSWLLVVIAASLVVSYAIVFVAEFVGQDERRTQPGPFQRPLTETFLCYLVALAASALMLWMYQRIDGPWHVDFAHIIVLGLPAAIGGAAGRLAT
jgi:putative integral membrane protein (TIGR02587 family)